MNSLRLIPEWLKKLPKVELHLHLEGSVRPEILRELARRWHVPLPAETLDGIKSWYADASDFSRFIPLYLTISRCLRTKEDLQFITQDLVQQLIAQNVLYCEVTYTPNTQWRQNGISFTDQWEVLRRVRDEARASGLGLNYVFDIVRNEPGQTGAWPTLEWTTGVFGSGAVALGLGGMEAGYPPELLATVFDEAAQRGIPAVPHAGETAGAESIWRALRALHAVRIGHGVRCLEDPLLVAELRERQIPLEVCPSSNVRLGVVRSWAEHPLKKLMDAGLCVTLNSDDPPLFDTTLTEEYHRAVQVFGLTEIDLKKLIRNAANAAFLSVEDNGVLLQKLDESPKQ